VVTKVLEQQEDWQLTEVRPVESAVQLRVTELSKAFGGQQVLDRLSVELHRGEVVLLRGANGSGKTTLLNILTGNLEPDAGTIALSVGGKTATFRFPRRGWQAIDLWNFVPERLAGLGVGRTWQDIRLFETQDLTDNIAVAAPGQTGETPIGALFRRSRVAQQEREIRQEARSILAQLGLEGRETSSGDRVSLGQSKRVAIARAVRAGAKILFLDEPLAGLDAPGIEDVMQLLARLARQEGVTLVIVEHVFNIPRILQLATTVWTLADSRLGIEPVEAARSTTVVAETGMRAWLEEIAGKEGAIAERSLPGGAVLLSVVPSGVESKQIALEVEDLVVYRGRRLVIGELGDNDEVKGLSFTLRRGELAVLQAPNGWGKTTLLEAIAGVLPVFRGRIRLQGRAIERLPVWERVRLGLSVLQARDNTFPTLTVREVLRLAKVDRIPDNVRGLLSKQMSDLSGGERQKVMLASAIGDRHFQSAMLDEPFSALDPVSVRNLQFLVGQLVRSSVGLLIAIPHLATRVQVSA